MDLELTTEQQQLDQSIATAMRRHAGADRARELADKMDHALLSALEDAGFLDLARDAGPVEAVLLVEQAGAAIARAPVAARALAGPLAGLSDLPPAVGLADRKEGSLVRYAPECEAFLVLHGDRALLATPDGVEIEPVESAFGAPYGRVSVRRGEEL